MAAEKPTQSTWPMVLIHKVEELDVCSSLS